ncbi:hypothetical protein C9374_013589 [Naegleria lovaniensis]|uniref:SCP domain-containing protein n=1 Tax=Naegleria lovaniensis TaxID=51637 RepID=A0AA88H1S3_NAELO|nr:uncharacterized protein C9374_013589 [Naegleria lovaniensis]KAG2392104.1 hypothetical protein C9374_013589 [Naegleria lovaniensis]
MSHNRKPVTASLILSFSLFLLSLMFINLFSSHASCQSINAFSSSEKTSIVNAHNTARFDSTLSPPAANMQSMVWDDALATTAANYVNQCVFAHNANRGSNVGENIYMGYSQTIGTAAVNSWASEKQYYNYYSGCQNGQVCGHYTQIIWASSVKVGCARKTCSTITGYPNFNGATIVVCNYSPAGNYNGQKPYVAGTAAPSTNKPNNGTNTKTNEAVTSVVGHYQYVVMLLSAMFVLIVTGCTSSWY